MNTVIISTVTADPFGVLSFKFDTAKSDLLSMERRVSKRATLDGGSVFEDYGFTHSDREFEFGARLNQAQIETLNYLIENASSVCLSVVDGFFLATLQRSKIKGSDATIKILIKEKLA